MKMKTIEVEETRRASFIPVDEVYTDSDMSPLEITPSLGYRYDFPNSWLNEYSTNKMISPRALLVEPFSHNFEFRIDFEYEQEPGYGKETTNFRYYVDKKQDVESWLSGLMISFDDWVKEFGRDEGVRGIYIEYDYNPRTGDLKLEIVDLADDGSRMQNMKFKFVFPELQTLIVPDEKYIILEENMNFIEFMRFLNQHPSQEMFEDLTTFTREKKFTEVWNRDRIFIHSNISTSHNQYLGMSGDFWPRPNKLFAYNPAMSDFNIRFTTDGKHCILPRCMTFRIELSFIINYDTVKLL